VDCRSHRWQGISQVGISIIIEHVLHVRFTARYNFEKPNDRRALDLMNQAAAAVMKDVTDIVIAYGVSDEFR
jgi:tRNA(His) 5'-end guanylyltransferase